jgi:hypothetical protein
MIQLKEIPLQDLSSLNLSYEDDVLYFYLLKNGQAVGTYLLKARGDQTAEVSLTLLPSYHYHQVLNRTALKALIAFPQTLGFKKLLTWTTWDSWKKLLKRFFKEVPAPAWDLDVDKTWLQQDYEKEGA